MRREEERTGFGRKLEGLQRGAQPTLDLMAPNKHTRGAALSSRCLGWASKRGPLQPGTSRMWVGSATPTVKLADAGGVQRSMC